MASIYEMQIKSLLQSLARFITTKFLIVKSIWLNFLKPKTVVNANGALKRSKGGILSS